MNADQPLYDKGAADALTRSERTEGWRIKEDARKAQVVLEHVGSAKSLLEIGCAWGQILRHFQGKIPVLAGLDESEDRLAGLRADCPGVRAVRARADSIPLPDASFDAVLASHMIHEIMEFGKEGDLARTLAEVRRVLTPGGRFIIIDHYDPGPAPVSIRLDAPRRRQLEEFQKIFVRRKVPVTYDGDRATLDRRDCQDFATKIWSLGTGAQDLEMNESHTELSEGRFRGPLAEAGFELERFTPFEDIRLKFADYGIELAAGEPWPRRFCLVAVKNARA